MDTLVNKLLSSLNAVDKVFSDSLKKDSKMENQAIQAEPTQEKLLFSSIDDFVSNNTAGPGGKRLTRFRRTQDQCNRGLSREEAFLEMNRALTAKANAKGEVSN